MSDQSWGTPSGSAPDGASDGAHDAPDSASPGGVPGPGAAGGAVPVCPRHPDRVSYVRCQRCGRPMCPQCQRPAPVGIQCVDCVSTGTRATAPRATFGEGAVSERPVVTLTIIGLCVAAFVAQMAVPGVTDHLRFVPALGDAEPWRFLSAAFLHASLLHIGFNMVALWMVGPFLEASLGRARYVTLYVLAALGGSAAMVIAAQATHSPQLWWTGVVGASGAVFGLFGAVLVVLRRTGRSAQGIVGVIALNVFLGFVVQGIAWQAHLGGLVVGATLGAAYAYAPRARRREISVAASVVVAAALVAVVIGIYQTVGLL